MRRFRAPGLPGEGQSTALEAPVSHHLLRVTGIAPGEALVLFDGEGQEAEAVLVEARGGLAWVRQSGPPRAVEAPQIHLLIGICKHAAMDTMLRMATELGARRIQPVLAARCVATGDRGDRWERIAESSAAQCGRADLPEIAPPLALGAALDTVPDGFARRVLVPGAPRRSPPQAPVALLVGPEGGLTEAEIALALSRGFEAESLGPRVLRADTAVAAVLARVT